MEPRAHLPVPVIADNDLVQYLGFLILTGATYPRNTLVGGLAFTSSAAFVGEVNDKN